MCVDARVSSCSCQVFAIFVRNVLACSRLSVSLSQTKVNDVHIVLFLTNSNQKVVRFDVSMKEMSRMYILDSLNHLISEHEHCFQRKFSLAVVEEIFKRWA
jgi:hypothetical protein